MLTKSLPVFHTCAWLQDLWWTQLESTSRIIIMRIDNSSFGSNLTIWTFVTRGRHQRCVRTPWFLKLAPWRRVLRTMCVWVGPPIRPYTPSQASISVSSFQCISITRTTLDPCLLQACLQIRSYATSGCHLTIWSLTNRQSKNSQHCKFNFQEFNFRAFLALWFTSSQNTNSQIAHAGNVYLS